jgi:hypothetical protein
MFGIHNKQKLKIEAINTIFKRSTYAIREVVIDYFNLEEDYIDLPETVANRFVRAYDTNPERAIVQEWIGITREYYIAKELNEASLLTAAAEKTDRVMNSIYKVFLHA